MLESGARTFTASIPKDDLAVFDRAIWQIVKQPEKYVREASAATKPAAPAVARQTNTEFADLRQVDRLFRSGSQ